MRPVPRLLSLVAALFLLPAAEAEEPWAKEPGWNDLTKQERKVLDGLLKSALKEDYRRQAVYLSERLLTIDPANTQAADVLSRWAGEALEQGQVPSEKWVRTRDQELAAVGTDYFHFGETLEASGMDPTTYYPINMRAHAYGSKNGTLHAALEQAEYVFIGTFGAEPRSSVDAALGELGRGARFPMEFDDDYLKAKARWPEARGIEWGNWRLITDHRYAEACRLIGAIAAAETWLLRTFGSKAPKKGVQTTNVLVFSEEATYRKVAETWITPEERERFAASMGWTDRGRNLILLPWRSEENGWLGDDDLLLGLVAQEMAQIHLGASLVGLVRGRGSWLLEGWRGAFEGFRVVQGKKGAEGEIDAASCWRLAVARGLREQGKLLPWAEFFELDDAKARALPRVTLNVRFGGAEREAKNIDVVAAQATAFVVGVLKAEKGGGPKALGSLVGDLIKRDSLPDLQKALGWKQPRIEEEANRAMDAAHGNR